MTAGETAVDEWVWKWLKQSVDFKPLPRDGVRMSEAEALTIAREADYRKRWPEVRISTDYGLYDGGVRNTSTLPNGELISHSNRLVWAIAFIGITSEITSRPDDRPRVRVKIIDAAAGVCLRGYQTPIPSDPTSEPPWARRGLRN